MQLRPFYNDTMSSNPPSHSPALSTLDALSPLDGRYAAKVDALRAHLSEAGLMRSRVQVEVAWFIGLSDLGLAEFPALSAEARDALNALVARFGSTEAAEIKAIERTTNHDVKAVEYWLKAQTADQAEAHRHA